MTHGREKSQQVVMYTVISMTFTGISLILEFSPFAIALSYKNDCQSCYYNFLALEYAIIF